MLIRGPYGKLRIVEAYSACRLAHGRVGRKVAEESKCRANQGRTEISIVPKVMITFVNTQCDGSERQPCTICYGHFIWRHLLTFIPKLFIIELRRKSIMERQGFDGGKVNAVNMCVYACGGDDVKWPPTNFIGRIGRARP